MVILLENLQKKVPLQLPAIKALVSTVLSSEKVEAGQISVVFVSRQRICALNRCYLHHHYATDVIAFDTSMMIHRRGTLHGDIVVSTDAAVQNSKIYGTSVATEIFLYIVHGILHLLGYDDHRPADIRRMRVREAAILKSVGKRVKGIIKK